MTDEEFIAMVHKNDEFVVFDDGYRYFFPSVNGGGMTSHRLRLIADELDRLNADWDRTVQNDPKISGNVG